MTQPVLQAVKDVEETKVAPKPTLSALRVKDDTATGWSSTRSTWRATSAGDERDPRVQGKKKYIRKGNVLIPAEPVEGVRGPHRGCAAWSSS
jgi:hypothetical protein